MADDVGQELADWGKVVMLGTHGRVTGEPALAAVGFVEAADGSLLVAAGDANSDWARNLAMDPRVTVTIEGATRPFVASELHGALRDSAVVALILKYGTPAERLGRGPAFRLDQEPAPVAQST